MIDQDAVDRERRLRELHGVLELAVMIAGDALAEAHPELSSQEWFQAMLSMAAKQLEAQHRFQGRWSLFTAEELAVLYEQMRPIGGGDDSAERDGLAWEILQERHVHGLDPIDEIEARVRETMSSEAGITTSTSE